MSDPSPRNLAVALELATPTGPVDPYRALVLIEHIFGISALGVERDDWRRWLLMDRRRRLAIRTSP